MPDFEARGWGDALGLTPAHWREQLARSELERASRGLPAAEWRWAGPPCRSSAEGQAPRRCLDPSPLFNLQRRRSVRLAWLRVRRRLSLPREAVLNAQNKRALRGMGENKS